DLSEVRSLDPSQVIATGASGGSALVAVYDQVMRLNMETWEYEPRMAESVEPNDDFTEWTITMRDGIEFSDGTPLDAEAVAGSMEGYLASKGYDTSLIAPLWDGVEVVDDLTVKVKLKESWATFPSMLARALGFIVAPAAISGDEFKPIGAGAFVEGHYSPGEELVLEANPNHWDGAPYLDQLRFVWLGEDQTKLDSMASGSVDVAYIQDPELVDEQIEAGTGRVTTLANMGRL